MAEPNTFIKLHRSILNSAVFTDAEVLRLWIYFLCQASTEDREIIVSGTVVKLKRGQLITGRKKLSQALGVSESKVYRMMKTLEETQCITTEAVSNFSVTTIVNWSKFQAPSKKVNSTRTAGEQKNEQQICRENPYNMGEIPKHHPKSEQQANSTTTKNRTAGEQQANSTRTAGEHNTRNIKNYKELYNYIKCVEPTAPAHAHISEAPLHGAYKNVLLSDEEFEALKQRFPNDWGARIDRLSKYMADSKKTYASHYDTIMTWAEQDEAKKRNERRTTPCNGFDENEAFAAALERSRQVMERKCRLEEVE